MSPADGTRSLISHGPKESQISPSEVGNSYGTIYVTGNASAVAGNVTHQHFYPSERGADTLNAAEDGNQSIELRSGPSQAQIDAISDYDHKYEHCLRAQRRLSNTCHWVTKLVDFQDWTTGRGPPILVCNGSVGCGKSITASAVIDWLDKARKTPDSFIISYYVDAARSRQTTASEVLRAFIKQIVLHYRSLGVSMPEDLSADIVSLANPATSITMNVPHLTHMIQLLLRLRPTSLFIVDGLDALSEPEIMVFLGFLRQVWHSPPFCGRMMLFCRETLGRRIRITSIPASAAFRVTLKHLEEDIHSYVDNKVASKQQECPITTDDHLIEEIKSVLKSNSEKMFLWIYLQVLSLWDPGLITCDQDIRDQLECLPEGIDEVYLRCVRRIDASNDKRSRDIAPRMFKWLASAQTTLKSEQAREAVSMTPDNLPLQQAQLLSYPVTDYCANLVVLDDLTDMIRFTHPSVVKFLSDPEKVPLDLRYLALLDNDKDLWCGRICTAHVKIHNARQQMVRFQPQAVSRKFASPILKSMFRDVLPMSVKRSLPTSNDMPFRVPVSAVSRRQGSSVTSMSLHDYICQHWLTHNTAITKDEPHYVDFENLCLTHDPDLQPWSTTQTTDVEHYRRMVMHAVLTDHVPLLQIAQGALLSRGVYFYDSVFQHSAPGTDSTYLHCAAVLGHVKMVKSLLEIKNYRGSLSDSQGVSAAATAMRARQIQTFRELIPVGHHSRFHWTLTLLTNAKRPISVSTEESLLGQCVRAGNLEAVQILLHPSLVARMDSHSFAPAFFLACRDGHGDIAKFLAHCGADYRNFYRSVDSCCRPNDEDTRVNALHKALGNRNLTMLRTLLIVRKTFGDEIDDLDLLHVLDQFKGNFETAAPYIYLLLEFGVTLDKSERAWTELWWLQEVIENSDLFMHSKTNDVNKFVRSVLHSSYVTTNHLTEQRYSYRLPGIINKRRFALWLAHATDDVLTQVVKLGWMSAYISEEREYIATALRRGSSRLLELIFSKAPLTQSSRPFSYSALTEITPGSYSLPRSITGRVNPSVFYTQVVRPQQTRNMHLLEYLRVQSHEKCRSEVESESEQVSPCVREAVRVRRANPDLQLYPLLMWSRCYAMTRGDLISARKMCDELERVGSDGNFALNFPTGYSLCNGAWMISDNIWLAIYRWSFRLNRAYHKPFSEGDVWYMARLLKVVGSRRNMTRERSGHVQA